MTDHAQIEREARAAVAAKQTVNDACPYPFGTPDAWRFQRYYQLAALELIKQLEPDAKRYRWLVGARTEAQLVDLGTRQPPPVPQDEVISVLASYYFSEESANAMIDAARAAHQKKAPHA